MLLFVCVWTVVAGRCLHGLSCDCLGVTFGGWYVLECIGSLRFCRLWLFPVWLCFLWSSVSLLGCLL